MTGRGQHKRSTCLFSRIRHWFVITSLFLATTYPDSVRVEGFSLLSNVGKITRTSPWPMTMKLADVKNQQRRDLSPASSPSNRGSSTLPGSPLSMVCNDQEEFELHVGHAMDVLRSDYPCILTSKPDFHIYDKDLEVVDPSGVKLHGLDNYKSAFSLLHAVVNIFYCPERSLLTFRMCYDKARQNIRIHWNAQVIPKAIFGGVKTSLHIDGISVYEISRMSGNITQHRVERLIINDAMVMPEQGIFSALRRHAKKEEVGQIPVYFNTADGPDAVVAPFEIASQCDTGVGRNQVVKFQSFTPFARQKSLLFFEAQNNDNDSAPPTASSTQLESMTSSSENLDWEAFERKNAYRKKFGLKPMTPEEFMELEDQVAELDLQQQQKAAATAAANLANSKGEKEEKGNFFQKLLGDALQDTCESNFDCQRPEVCCDFGFTKRCCTSGMRIVDGPRSREGQWAEVPVIADPNPYPPTNGRDKVGRGGGNYNGY